jgi:hypothetical protein
MKSSLMKKLLIVFGILVILGAAAAFYVYRFVYNKPHTDYAKAEPAMVLRAKRLFTDYYANKENADKMYLDKVVEIEGTLSNVEVADTMVIIVFAYRAGNFGDEGIRVTVLPEFREEAKKLSFLKPIKLKGHCTGYNGTDVIIENGSIVPNFRVINAPAQQ